MCDNKGATTCWFTSRDTTRPHSST